MNPRPDHARLSPIRRTGRLTAALAAVGILAGAGLGVGTAYASPAPHVLTPAPATCPSGDRCTTIPAQCPTTDCPEVVAGPTSGLGPEQWIFVDLYDFAPGDVANLAYCANVAALSAAEPLCDVDGSQTLPNPTIQIPIESDGTASISFQVEEDENEGGNAPLDGTQPGGGNDGTFFCDNGPATCAVDVTDPSLVAQADPLVPVDGNTAVIPVSFSPDSIGCAAAADVDTVSDFGIEQLLPAAGATSCAGTDPAIALNTAQDSLAAVQALTSGNAQVAFTDDPEAPAEQALLTAGHDKLIPVALTANVVGFKAIMLNTASREGLPDNLFELTPDEVAGLITNYYSYPDNTDLVPCSSGEACPAPVACPGTGSGQCTSLMSVDNPTGTFTSPQLYGAYMRADATGTTDSLLSWICAAPDVPVTTPGGYEVSDPNQAPATLGAGLGAGHTACPATSQFPALPNAGTSSYTISSSPSQQIGTRIGLQGWVSPPSPSAGLYAGFVPMIWSEAEYYGLNIASLQNAAGQWSQPTQTSIDAALADATTNPDGSVTPDYDNTGDSAAYPMPVVIYAAVPTAPQPASQIAAEQSMLNSLLAVASRSTADLPGGFVQLPEGLYAQASKDVSSDLVAQSPAKTTTPSNPPKTGTDTTPGNSTTGSGGSSTSGSGLFDAYTGGVLLDGGPLFSPGLSRLLPGAARAGTTGAVVAHRGPGLHVPTPLSLTLASDLAGRAWLKPALIGGVLGGLLLGPGLLLAVELKRRATVRAARRGDPVPPGPRGDDPLPVGAP